MMSSLSGFESSHWALQPVCSADAHASVSWSDIPCQGDYLIDFRELRCSQETILHTSKNYTSYPSPPPSPRSLSEELLCELNHSDKTKKTSPSSKKTVRFAEVAEIRTYEVILGDHPFCRGGMALQLGWAHDGTELVNFEIFENASRHRSMAELHLSFFHRRERLRNLTGMSGCDLLRAEYELLCDAPVSPPTVLRRSHHVL